MSFHRKNGRLYCEDVAVRDVIARAGEAPFYLYSLDRLRANYHAYADSAPAGAVVAYAIKANGNLHLLRHLAAMGAGAVLVSGGELQLARAAGFSPEQTVFNGNGKTTTELRAAVAAGVLVNIDSEFDIAHLEAATAAEGVNARALLRVNPDMDAKVHPYVSTGIRDSKFGLDATAVPRVIERLQRIDRIRIVGVHCHLGSTVADVTVYRDAATAMKGLLGDMRARGLQANVLNMGGGLGIDGGGATPRELMDALGEVVTDEKLIVEPGRSLVGNAGVFVCGVIGVKSTPAKHFIVTNGSMAELIRPSLYGAHHPIEFAEDVGGKSCSFDIVGPVCESGDFLGRDRDMATPSEGDHVVVFEAGAYGFAMSSNYNARLRPAEYLVDGESITCIRRSEAIDDLMRGFATDDAQI